MATLSELFTQHHRRCDDAWALAEEAAAGGDWPRATQAFDTFTRGMAGHFDAEEQALFPAFESATGMQGGPPQMMRLEHQQMRGLLDDMKQALAAKDAEGFTGAGDTLLVLMQQHNLKEENILYPMCDQAVGGEAALMQEVQRRLEQA